MEGREEKLEAERGGTVIRICYVKGEKSTFDQRKERQMPTSFLKVMTYNRKLIFIVSYIYKNISGVLACMYV